MLYLDVSFLSALYFCLIWGYESVYFKVFTLWPRGRLATAATPNITPNHLKKNQFFKYYISVTMK